eukprot:403364816
MSLDLQQFQEHVYKLDSKVQYLESIVPQNLVQALKGYDNNFMLFFQQITLCRENIQLLHKKNTEVNKDLIDFLNLQREYHDRQATEGWRNVPKIDDIQISDISSNSTARYMQFQQDQQQRQLQFQELMIEQIDNNQINASSNNILSSGNTLSQQDNISASTFVNSKSQSNQNRQTQPAPQNLNYSQIQGVKPNQLFRTQIDSTQRSSMASVSLQDSTSMMMNQLNKLFETFNQQLVESSQNQQKLYEEDQNFQQIKQRLQQSFLNNGSFLITDQQQQSNMLPFQQHQQMNVQQQSIKNQLPMATLSNTQQWIGNQNRKFMNIVDLKNSSSSSNGSNPDNSKSLSINDSQLDTQRLLEMGVKSNHDRSQNNTLSQEKNILHHDNSNLSGHSQGQVLQFSNDSQQFHLNNGGAPYNNENELTQNTNLNQLYDDEEINQVLLAPPKIEPIRHHIAEVVKINKTLDINGKHKYSMKKSQIIESFVALLAYQAKYQEIFMRYPQIAGKFVLIRSNITDLDRAGAKKLMYWLASSLKSIEHVGTYRYDEKSKIFRSNLFMIQKDFNYLEEKRIKDNINILEMTTAECNEQENQVRHEWEAVSKLPFGELTSFTM